MAIQAYERCRAVLADQLDAPAVGGNPAAAGRDPRRRPTPPAPRPRPSPRRPRAPAADLEREAATPAPAPSTSASSAPSRRQARRAPRGGARVGVLPLQLVGTTEQEAHLAAGLADEITSALARFRWMFLVSSSSLARYADADPRRDRDPPRLRHRLPAGRHDPARRAAAAHLPAPARPARRQPGGLVAPLRPRDARPADAAGRDRRRGGGADRPRDPADRGAARRRAPARTTPPPTTSCCARMPLISRLERPLFMQAGELLRQAIGAGAGLRRAPMPGTPTGTCSWSARAGR